MRTVYINLHGIGTPARDLEAGEAPYWISEDFYVEILDRTLALKGRVEARFTFDDGNASDIQIGAEALNRRGLSATFFPLSDRIDAVGSLSAADIRALRDDGHGIGNHGAAHVSWKRLDSARQAREWREARAAIAEASGAPVTEAAIPFGSYDGAVIRGLKAEGYARVYSSDGGAAAPGHYPTPRTSPRNDMTMDDIENLLLGRESLKTTLRRSLAMSVKRRV